MDSIGRFLARIRYVFSSRRRAEELAAELEAHRAHVQAHLESEGVPPAEAITRSRRAMGNVTLAREDAQEVWLGSLLHRAWRDGRYGARALRREPTFAAAALLALTLGIATTTTMFSVVDAELWKPLPFPDSGQLVVARAMKDGRYSELTQADLTEWRGRSRLVRYAAAASSERHVLRTDGAESVTARPVTSDFLGLLGVRPPFGRGFEPADEQGARVAILSDTGWTRLFGRDVAAVGRAVSLDDVPYTIVGITAGVRFEFTSDPDFFVLLGTGAAGTTDRPSRMLDIYGRMQAGVGMGEAEAELRSFEAEKSDRALKLVTLQQDASSYNWRELYFFLGAAGVLLLLSGLNVAGLLLARALRRQREFAIRGALGGGLAALVRQLVVEGALLAIPAAAAGLLAATWLLHLLTVSIPPGHLERGGHIELDLRGAAFVLTIGGLTTIVLAVTPLLFARRIDLNVTLGQGGRAIGPSRRQRGVRAALLTAQVTATVVLLGAAALLAVSFHRTTRAPIGFDPADRVALRLALSGTRYAGDASISGFAEGLLEQARAVGGVRHAAVGSSSPLDSHGGAAVQIVVPDQPRPARGKEPTALITAASPDYFQALGIRRIAGREFQPADLAGAPRVAIVNELLARRLFPGQNAIGRQLEIIPRLRTGWTNRPGLVLIVGIVNDVRNFAINEVAFNSLYLPFAQAPSAAFELVVDAAVPPGEALPALRAAVARVDAGLPVTNTTTLESRVDDALRGDRFNLIVAAFFAAAATLLAAIGIYGAMACSVQERAREFGIRIALGALPGTVVRAALSTAVRVAAIGGAAGLAVSVGIAKLLGNALYLVEGQHGGLLYDVKVTDPFALGSAAAALILVVIAAGLIPARQALRVDPLTVLKAE